MTVTQCANCLKLVVREHDQFVELNGSVIHWRCLDEFVCDQEFERDRMEYELCRSE